MPFTNQKRELTQTTRKLDSLIDAIADGLRAPSLQYRLDELEARREALSVTRGPPTPVRLHPNLFQVHRRQVRRLQDAVQDAGGSR